jgi:sigma-E factor negative regulatory protein RseC
MEQYGQVIEKKGETASVDLQRHLACASCGKCGILSGSNKRRITVEALNPINAEVGQRVLLESDDRQIIFISFMLYLVPLAGLLGGIILWLRIADLMGLAGSQELGAAVVGFALMAMIFLLIRIWDRRVKDNPQYKPVITALIEAGTEECSNDDSD